MRTLKFDLEYLGTKHNGQGLVFFHIAGDTLTRPHAFVAVSAARPKLDQVDLEFTDMGILIKATRRDEETPVEFTKRVLDAIQSSVPA